MFLCSGRLFAQDDFVDSRIRVIYRFKADAATIESRARGIAVEQSVEMPVEPIDDRYVLDNIVGRVERIEPAATGETGCYDVEVSLATVTTGLEAGQLANMLMGNSSLQRGVELIDATFPDELAAAFGGPNHGLEGLRRRVGASGALSCTALKPQGSPPAVLARIAYDIALGGIDYIKDDHGIADQVYSPFALRVPAIAEAVSKARLKTGIDTRYLPSLNGSYDAMCRQIEICRGAEVDTVLITPMLCGLAQFQALKRANPDFAFIAHPSFGGLPMAPSFLFAKLFRLIGADGTIFPNYGGRFSYSKDECRRIAGNATSPWLGLAASVPVPAGGMTLARIPEMLEFFGRDVMLLIGGSLLSAKDKITEETAKFCAAVRAA
jgi:ribulose-bisphosphate carboxylase large chain